MLVSKRDVAVIVLLLMLLGDWQRRKKLEDWHNERYCPPKSLHSEVGPGNPEYHVQGSRRNALFPYAIFLVLELVFRVVIQPFFLRFFQILLIS